MEYGANRVFIGIYGKRRASSLALDLSQYSNWGHKHEQRAPGSFLSDGSLQVSQGLIFTKERENEERLRLFSHRMGVFFNSPLSINQRCTGS